ncbi:PAS domain-containing protein [Metabacillus sp. KIGAM252]|uniref:PAS domain-containing protein n=1 Tax=Metabacillus flavus TaxID=2823519 RepID=A0ABS5LDA4_9BACI|nr:STAS domain-containing protein [Metabacillus flavus]MBS2968724.1 PAS domain-containing protein [Metabacillus flavus]
MMMSDELFKKTLDSTHVGISVTDPSLPDNPLVYVNQGFVEMTGYSHQDVLGKNCRFLQGKNTSFETVGMIKKALKDHKPILIEIVNYRKDGSAFWNELHIEPAFVESEQKTYFIGIQKNVTKQKEYLERITELSTPIVPISDKLSVLPLIGELSNKRSEEVLNAVSSYASEAEDHAIIVDLSGLVKVEKDEVASLLKLYNVLNMMGTELILTGVTPLLIMETSTDLIGQLSSIRTYMNVKQAINALN